MLTAKQCVTVGCVKDGEILCVECGLKFVEAWGWPDHDNWNSLYAFILQSQMHNEWGLDIQDLIEYEAEEFEDGCYCDECGKVISEPHPIMEWPPQDDEVE
uniref:Uncharacterized protein n=1 Tax=viral metagenome TaxID=1070528 RepID=A0A6M3LPV3_9ZZZZ